MKVRSLLLALCAGSAMQAAEAMKWILGAGELLVGCGWRLAHPTRHERRHALAQAGVLRHREPMSGWQRQHEVVGGVDQHRRRGGVTGAGPMPP